VNVIAPGVVDTAVWSENQKKNLENWATEKLLIKHLGSPQELAEAYISLMTNEYITGVTLKVDGGLTLT
jgi:NAD(P)-dependent dehydrogenase (short-subunit alcohol dehydrogenase family)